jgi:hypothetical protein
MGQLKELMILHMTSPNDAFRFVSIAIVKLLGILPSNYLVMQWQRSCHAEFKMQFQYMTSHIFIGLFRASAGAILICYLIDLDIC